MVTPAILPFGLGLTELIIILAIVLLIFGPKKLPDLGKALGQTVRELRKSSQGDDEKKEAAPAEKIEAKESTGAGSEA